MHPDGSTTDVLYDSALYDAMQQRRTESIPPLLGIFFAEFDVHRGTVLSVQVCSFVFCADLLTRRNGIVCLILWNGSV